MVWLSDRVPSLAFTEIALFWNSASAFKLTVSIEPTNTAETRLPTGFAIVSVYVSPGG